eukprot:CAMPEP_0117669422 /NCGR_PEP_ID=MMETSP0804-20121206/12126_1 /TAXON_ID=1074897 /ORGANISM="Tetraselmis astigmatica, Strain CCMP880" /LENGTH=360 /DNA_ID=CAMNT_0005477483 /DNA_START=311 /DNA_END=1394 /DNA_ORIENTATION=+
MAVSVGFPVRKDLKGHGAKGRGHKGVNLAGDVLPVLQAIDETRVDAAQADLCPDKSAQHRPAVHILPAAVGIGQQPLLKPGHVLSSHDYEAWEGLWQVASGDGISHATCRLGVQSREAKLRGRRLHCIVQPGAVGHHCPDNTSQGGAVVFQHRGLPGGPGALDNGCLGLRRWAVHGAQRHHAGQHQPVHGVHVVVVVVRALVQRLAAHPVGEEHAVAGAGIGIVVAPWRGHELLVGRGEHASVEGATIGHRRSHQQPHQLCLEGVLSCLQGTVVVELPMWIPVLLLSMVDDVPDYAPLSAAAAASTSVGLTHYATWQLGGGLHIASDDAIVSSDLRRSAVVPMGRRGQGIADEAAPQRAT